MNLLKMTLLNNMENNFCRRTISLFLFAGICAGMFMSITIPAYAQEEVPEASETMPISLEDGAAAPVSAETHDTSTPYIFTKPVKVNAHKRYNQKQFDALLKRAKPYYNQMKNDCEKDSFDKGFIKFYEKVKKEKVTDENGRYLENYIHAYDLGAPYTKEDIQNDINEARSYQRHSLFVSLFNNKEHKELKKVVESVNREMTKKRMSRDDREGKHRAITQQLEKTKKADEKKVANMMKYVAPSVFAVGAVLAITVYLRRRRKLGLGKKVLLGVMLGGTLVGFLCTDIRADQYGTLAWNSDYTQYQATNEYDWGSEGLTGVKTYETFNMTQESIADNGDITYSLWMAHWANVDNFKSWKKAVNIQIGNTNIVMQPDYKAFTKTIRWTKGDSITLKAGQTYSINVSIYNVAESGFYNGTITVPKKIESDITYHGNGGTYDNGKTELKETVKNGTAYKTKENFFTRKGYKFKGWTEIRPDGSKVDWTSWINKEWTWTYLYDAHLYAHWKLDSYYIDYNVNDAGLTDHITDNLPDNNGSLPGKDTAAMLTDFALQKGSKYNTKYTFKEWNTKPDGSGKKFTTSITNDGSLCKPGETLTLYAIWDTTPIMSAKDFYLIEEVPAPNDVVYSGVGFDKTPTEKYPDKLSEVAYPIKGYTKNGTDISSRIKVEYVEFDGSKTVVSSIDTNKPGKYTVHYSLTDGKQTKKFTRTVTVLPISAPAINAGDRYFKVNTLITADMLKETVSVNDKYDGDLIDKVIIENIDNIKSDKDGVYQITYKVTNRANKTTTKTVNIFIIDYLPDNRADEANKFRFVRKDCSEANDYCLQYFDNDSKWANDETLRELLMNSLSKSENETAIKKFKLSSKNSSSKNKN